MEGEQSEMDMNRIEGPGAPRRPTQTDKAPSRRPSAQPKGASQAKPDSVDISDDARKLIEQQPAPAPFREARIEAARRKLASGELDQAEAYAKAAEKLLRSGELKKVKDDGPAGASDG